MQEVGGDADDTTAPNPAVAPAARVGAHEGAVNVVPPVIEAFQADDALGPPAMVTDQGLSAVPERFDSVTSTVAPVDQESVTFQVKTMSSAAATGAAAASPNPSKPAAARSETDVRR